MQDVTNRAAWAAAENPMQRAIDHQCSVCMLRDRVVPSDTELRNAIDRNCAECEDKPDRWGGVWDQINACRVYYCPLHPVRFQRPGKTPK